MNNDFHVFRFSKKTIWKICVGYTVHMLMIVLQYFYNFIYVQCLFLLSGRMAYFWKRSYRKNQRHHSWRVRKRPLGEVGSYMVQGSSEPRVVCPSVYLLTIFFKISTLDIFYIRHFISFMWLSIFNLQKNDADQF